MTTGVGSLEPPSTRGPTPVSKRVSPTDRLRAEVKELLGSGRALTSILEDVARLSVRLMLQTALEVEVDAFLGRARYQRRDVDGPAGRRNGWQPRPRGRRAVGASARH